MNHSCLLFLAPENCLEQATPISPPAKPRPVPGRAKSGKQPLRFVASVIGNALGFGVLLAGCWFSLQLMQALLI